MRSRHITASNHGTGYTTTDSLVASISPEGLITAQNDGTATITIANGEVSAKLDVTVVIKNIAPPDPTAYISGTILDRATDQPIANAGIKERSIGTIINSDAQGKFLYPLPQGGSYTIYIEKTGYVTSKREIVVDSGKTASIELERMTPYEATTTRIDAAADGSKTTLPLTPASAAPPVVPPAVGIF